MKLGCGVSLIIAGIFLAAYLGLYVLFYGGVVDVVNALQMKPVPASSVALGLIKIIGASAGAIPGYLLCLFGWAIACSR